MRSSFAVKVLPACGLAAMLCAGPSAQPDEGPWNARIKAGIDMQMRGDTAGAAAVFGRLVHEAEADGATDRLRTALDNLAFVYRDMGRDLDAERCFLRELTILRTKRDSAGAGSITVLNSLLSLYVEGGEYVKAQEVSKRLA